jgi:hypothetical protein
MMFFRLVLNFAPWIALLTIAQGSLFRLKLGLVVALVLTLILGLARLQRGVIFWAGLIFFSLTTLAVLGFEETWTIRYMGILSNGTLALVAWSTLAIGKPFTLDFARAHTDPSRWTDPIFIRTNQILTAAWGLTFTLNAILAFGKMESFLLSDGPYQAVNMALLVTCAAFTSWYPGHVRRRLQSA